MRSGGGGGGGEGGEKEYLFVLMCIGVGCLTPHDLHFLDVKFRLKNLRESSHI